jgi:hypothetical protein
VALFEAWPNHRRLARQGSAPDQVPNPMAILALTPRRGLQKVDSAMAQVTTDHNTIRKWAEKKGGKPAAVKRTHQGGDVGIIRIMFPDRPQSEHEALEQISWDEFFRQFEQSKLALLYEEDSLFSKIVGRDTVERREHGEKHAAC